MIPNYIIEKMDSDWKKAAAHTENFIQEIMHFPFAEGVKDKMIAALKCNIALLEENERLLLELECRKKEVRG